MIRIIKRSTFHETVEYRLSFDYKGERGHGYSFECDERGVVDCARLNPAAADSLARCLAGEGTVFERRKIERREHAWREPAIGRCHCGAEVELSGFTNTCHRCDRDYNSAGQELAPREQWGEETGETLADIIGPQRESELDW